MGSPRPLRHALRHHRRNRVYNKRNDRDDGAEVFQRVSVDVYICECGVDVGVGGEYECDGESQGWGIYHHGGSGAVWACVG